MKNTHKKIVGGLVAGMILAIIGAVYAAEQTDGTISDTDQEPPFVGQRPMNRQEPYSLELTDEQQTEVEAFIDTLRDQNATSEEMRIAIQEKLDEFGVFDAQLDAQIASTEQRLTILNREKEFRDQGYSWTDINTMIQDEFDLQNATGIGPGIMMEPGFGQGPSRGPRGEPDDVSPLEESDL